MNKDEPQTDTEKEEEEEEQPPDEEDEWEEETETETEKEEEKGKEKKKEKEKEEEEEEKEEEEEVEEAEEEMEMKEKEKELEAEKEKETEQEKGKRVEPQESLVKILRRRSTRIRWKDEDSSSSTSDSDEVEVPFLRGSRQSVGSGMSLTLVESTIKSMIALPDEKIDMLTATHLLHQQATEIKKEQVNWHSYFLSQMISEDDYNFIIEFDGGGGEDDEDGSQARANLLRANRQQAAKTFFNILEHLSKDQTIQYALIMIDDMLQEDRKRVEIFREYCAETGESVWRPFLNLLDRPDGFIANMSSRIITKIACWSQELMDKSDLHFYLKWLRDQLRDTSNEYMESVARCLQMMLRVDEYRAPFVSMDGINVLLDVLQRRLNYQVQYQLIFCLWVLTFNPILVEKMHKYNLIPTLVYVLSNSAKDKVTRIILSLFRNLIETPEDVLVAKEHCVAMVQCKVLKQLNLLAHRKFDDEDIIADIVFLNEKLLASLQELSSFDEYTSQIKSGHLDWSPVHKSAKFWRENAVRFNEENYELLRTLIHLLETSKDPLILSVACFDIGEYVRYYPKGKHVIDELGGKQLVMQLLGHDDPNVRYEALLAVQKLMVHSWEYLEQKLEEQQIQNSKSAISTSSMSVK